MNILKEVISRIDSQHLKWVMLSQFKILEALCLHKLLTITDLALINVEAVQKVF